MMEKDTKENKIHLDELSAWSEEMRSKLIKLES